MSEVEVMLEEAAPGQGAKASGVPKTYGGNSGFVWLEDRARRSTNGGRIAVTIMGMRRVGVEVW